jgi:hypothetical protein
MARIFKTMIVVNAHSLAPDANSWLANTQYPRILHVFEEACNLINERKEILSIVTPQIGNGPFNLVIEEDINFQDHINLESPISSSPNSLQLGKLKIFFKNSQLWNPKPNWDALHLHQNQIRQQLQITNYQNLQSPITSLQQQFSNSLISNDLQSTKIFASKLAGLGIGLTPAGDDFIMGALHAAWIIHPQENAHALGESVAGVCEALTTSLSAAYIKSAGKGEAGELWHDFFNSLILQSPNLQSPISNILAIGHTSGADAMAGFLAVILPTSAP